jgi:hypothetical protein
MHNKLSNPTHGFEYLCLKLSQKLINDKRSLFYTKIDSILVSKLVLSPHNTSSTLSVKLINSEGLVRHPIEYFVSFPQRVIYF